jgi:hypothetical protein
MKILEANDEIRITRRSLFSRALRPATLECSIVCDAFVNQDPRFAGRRRVQFRN